MAERTWLFVAGSAVRGAREAKIAIERHYGPDGILARTLPTGAMAFWTTVMLAAYLVLSYL